MGTSRVITERQLVLARDAVQERAQLLTEAGFEAEEHPRDPRWRKLNSKAKQVNARLRKIGEIEAQNVALVEHKAKREVEVAEKKAARTAEIVSGTKKEAKEAPVAKAKPEAKAKGEGKSKGDGAKKDKAPAKKK